MGLWGRRTLFSTLCLMACAAEEKTEVAGNGPPAPGEVRQLRDAGPTFAVEGSDAGVATGEPTPWGEETGADAPSEGGATADRAGDPDAPEAAPEPESDAPEPEPDAPEPDAPEPEPDAPEPDAPEPDASVDGQTAALQAQRDVYVREYCACNWEVSFPDEATCRRVGQETFDPGLSACEQAAFEDNPRDAAPFLTCLTESFLIAGTACSSCPRPGSIDFEICLDPGADIFLCFDDASPAIKAALGACPG
jgi:hypothetical protein